MCINVGVEWFIYCICSLTDEFKQSAVNVFSGICEAVAFCSTVDLFF